jgi:hypothetical protein
MVDRGALLGLPPAERLAIADAILLVRADLYGDFRAAIFRNREALLPRKPFGYYREYNVDTVGSRGRGKRRLVLGAGGEVYYTDDHYRSFISIGALGDRPMVSGFAEAYTPYIASARVAELIVDASRVRDKAGFMRALAGALTLPDYFGANWDALEECLADMQAAGAAPRHYVVRNAAALNAADPAVLATFADILDTVGGTLAVEP